MQAIFVTSGAGIKPGASAGNIVNLDVAPTVAKLLGLTLPAAQGHVLTAILQ